MKSTQSILVFLAFQALAGVAPAAESAVGSAEGIPEIRYTVRVTEERLMQLRKDSKPFAGVSATGQSPSREKTFAETSDFIVLNKTSTFVPKSAILHLPDGLQQHVVQAPVGTLLIWKDFLARNIATVAPFEVTIEEATGAKPIDPKRFENAAKSARILVAVINGFPSSVVRK